MGLGHESQKRKTELDRMAAMPSRLGGRGYQVREGSDTYGQYGAEVDTDPDSDSDLDERSPNQAVEATDCLSPCHQQIVGDRLSVPLSPFFAFYVFFVVKFKNLFEQPRARSALGAECPAKNTAPKGQNVTAQGETLGCRFAADLRPEGAQQAVEPLL